MMELQSTAFKAYDIRGQFPNEVNEELAYRIGRVFPTLFDAKKVVVGHDIRLSGPEIQRALELGLTEMGCDVVSIGQCGTEMIYFATDFLDLDGGIMITASHNPKSYNGMKLVRKNARPISSDTGLNDIRDKVMAGELGTPAVERGKIYDVDIMEDYIQHLLTYIDVDKCKKLKIVVNSGNGSAGPIIDQLEKHLPFEFIKVHNTPDGNFPNGVPNPILEENREATAEVVRREHADLGVAFDGDFDRCFIFDEKGNMIEGYYIVGFLAEAFLKKAPGSTIIYDPRLTWNTLEIVKELGGRAVMCKSGHAFIKEMMRKENAIYGGEMSAHNYFRDFTFCDSGMITWLLVAELLSVANQPMSELLASRMDKYPISGEINSKVEDAARILVEIEERYGKTGAVDKTDGLSIEFPEWRFNVRTSNTEPVMRLNVEARGDKKLLQEKTDELLAIIRG